MFKTRVLTAAMIAPLFCAALFFLPELAWNLLILCLGLLALWEWALLVKLPSLTSLGYLLVSALLILPIALNDLLMSIPDVYAITQSMLFANFIMASVFWLILVPFWLRYKIRLSSVVLRLGLGWVVVLPLLAGMMHLRKESSFLLIAILAVVWIADSVAYFVGKAFGRHRLAPNISPGKTWEGLAGACLAVTVYAMIICLHWSISLILLPVFWGIALLSVMGDLFESLIKRHSEVKDSGSLLPGHGGLLDRVDGLTASVPVAAMLVFMSKQHDLLGISSLLGALHG